MREIKFRGKNIDNNWIYGFLIWHSGEWAIVDNVTPITDFIDYEVKEDTIGQFTGLIDKNGKEIYEGDIINVKEGYCGNPNFFSRGYKCEVKWGDRVLRSPDVFEMEIIGNIHDNKDLIETNN